MITNRKLFYNFRLHIVDCVSYFIYIIKNIMEIHSCHFNQIKNADFPLNHDCILKVFYNPGLTMLRYEFFSCRSHDSGRITQILLSSSLVRNVICVDVDDVDKIL